MMKSTLAHTLAGSIRRLVLLGVFALTALQYLYAGAGASISPSASIR